MFHANVSSPIQRHHSTESLESMLKNARKLLNTGGILILLDHEPLCNGVTPMCNGDVSEDAKCVNIRLTRVPSVFRSDHVSLYYIFRKSTANQ